MEETIEDEQELEEETSEELEKVLEKLADLKAEEDEIKEEYASVLEAHGIRTIMQDKVSKFWNEATRQLKQHLKAYFKEYSALPKGNIYDPTEFTLFNNVVLILLPYKNVIAYESQQQHTRIPRRLVNHIDYFKRLYPFIMQLSTSYNTKVNVSAYTYQYKIIKPAWYTTTGKPSIGYVNELVFHKLYSDVYVDIAQTVEDIITDLYDIINVSDILLESKQKSEKLKAEFSDD